MNEISSLQMHHCGLIFIHIVVTINNNNKEQNRQSQLRIFIIFTGLSLQYVLASTGHRQVTQNNENTEMD